MKNAKLSLRKAFRLRTIWLVIAVAAGSVGVLSSARAQSDYPNRPVQLIIAYGAGTIGDVSMRILAEKLSNKLGKNFVVENRPGAAGVIAAKAAAMAAPDGYTLVLLGNSYAISTALFRSLPYDVVKDFAPISAVATFDFLVATKKDSKFKSMQDVIAYAKANPGKLNIATLSPGTTQYLAVELLKVAAGVDVTAVTFRSSPDAASALLRGDVDLDMDSYAPLRSLLDAGKIDVIATTGRNRVSFLTGVPTVIESGLPNFDVTSWNGVAAPTGVPAPIIAKLNKAVNEALQSPEAQETGRKLGMEMRGSTTEELAARLKGDIVKWSNLIETAHIPKHD
ncbi:MAG TPA: tripartite tricarboxylate transporter substrate-binding protein [Pseudolabrys sp.]|nr:tripartite tricarboxylate transporter substrate-binding protein [Pseudolabrys sp.]